MKYEELIQDVGGCGRYQIFILSLLYISSIFDGLQVGSMIFIIPNIKYRCAIPGLPNDTYEVQSESHGNLIQEYIPEETVDGKTMYNQCNLYANKTVQGINQTLHYCTSWVYDKSIFQTSMTSDFNLVCGRKWLAQQTYSSFFAGYLVAMLSCGWLSDRLGRKAVVVGALIVQGLSGILSSQIMNIHVILVLRFFTALGNGGSFIPAIVMGAEISTTKKRTHASIAIELYFTVGLFIINLLAFYIRTWKLLLLLASIPSIPTALLFIWVMPESPRWLLTVNKKKKAESILNKIAEVNKSNFRYKIEEVEISVTEGRTVKLWKIFTIPTLLKRTLIMMYNWCVVVFVYYALVLNTEHLSGDIYLNFFFGALVEIPAYTICMLLLNRVGRKKLYIAFMFIGGINGILTIFPAMYASDDLQWTTTAMAILSKLCITGTFGILYLHTCELYPTCVRNGAVGAHSTFSRVGGIIAPYIMLMRAFAPGKLGDSLPLLTMGFVCIIAGVSYLFLPETSNRPMEDTFDDILKKDFQRIRKKDEYEFEAKAALNPST